MDQPGQLGAKVYCPVSGVLFDVKEASARRTEDGVELVFCCESCARYFTDHADRVLDARALRRR